MSVQHVIPVIIYLAGMGVGLSILRIWHWHAQRARRQTPLTRDLLHGPGHSLRARIDHVTFDVVAYFSLLPSLPLLFYAMYLHRRAGGVSRAAVEFALALTLAVAIAWLVYKLMHTLMRLRRLRLGLDAELATGQELDQLMREGYRVFHDVPGSGFNIDHVVIGRNGVFAVETKARTKPIQSNDKAEWRMEYDGKTLIFPHGRETAPLAQAERQAKWLREWLSSAVGEPIPVMPVVALPGWWINRTQPGGVPVFNAANPVAFLRQIGNVTLNDKLQQQIAHQLEQRCRDVAPRAYPKKKSAVAEV